MTLAELLIGAGIARPPQVSEDALSRVVQDVVQDSRRVRPGSVFIARRGDKHDGHRFADKAVAQGAVAIVGSAPEAEQANFSWTRQVPYIYVLDDKLALAQLAAQIYEHPSKAMHVTGITGTDGKTTTSFMLYHLLSGVYPTSLLSTAGIRVLAEPAQLEGHFTTPEASEVQMLLAKFQEAGSSHVVLESSSHGLAMKRLAEVDYDLAIWTNLTPEHLDFHKTFEAYREAKLELVQRAKVSVINLADANAGWFVDATQQASGEVISYALQKTSGQKADADINADWQAEVVREDANGITWMLRVPKLDVETDVLLPMVGRYNVENALAALTAAHHIGIPLDALLERITTFSGVAGRMQRISSDLFNVPFSVIVDFAHTPDSLEKALTALRPQVTGKLIVVVGAAGERDPGKRAGIGRVAVQHADYAVFTEEDSRSEHTKDILSEIARSANQHADEDKDFVRIEDRREAIHHAIHYAQAGDLVLLAGKGHETSLERAQETLTWDEAAEALNALQRRNIG
ncbi:MAG: UDP-N-acetylmuramoyl-L-alanyl-D-glutamate--2,6-diaminopimelate ligase [Deinococcota bacterium]